MTKKISELAAASAMDGTELLEVVQGGVSKRSTPAEMLAALGVAPAIESPLDIDGCVLWLDASDATTINAGSPSNDDPVTTWADKSGNDYDAAQATADNKPVYKTNVQNGKSIIRFDPTSDPQWLALSGAALGILNNAPGVTIACAAKNNDLIGNDSQILWISSGTSANRDRAQLLSGISEAYISVTNDDANSDENNQHVANEPGNPFVQIGRAQLANNIIVDIRLTAQWAFQTPVYAGTAGNFPATDSLAIKIGVYPPGPDQGASIDLYELTIWPRCLNGDELAQEFRRLSLKWGTFW